MSSLNRKLAPLSDAAWQSIDNEAEQVLKVMLAGRKLVDFNGPLGWETSAIDIGRIENAKRTDDRNVSVHVRKVQPLAELRREFEIARSEIDAIDRGAKDADLDPVVSTARDMAVAEDSALFGGLPEANIGGICPLSEHKPLKIS